MVGVGIRLRESWVWGLELGLGRVVVRAEDICGWNRVLCRVGIGVEIRSGENWGWGGK